MKKTTQLIEKIQHCNLSAKDKKTLIDTLNNTTADYTNFISEFLKVIGISKRLFDLFPIDIGDWIDKFF